MTAADPERGHDLLVVADRIHTCSAAGTVGALFVSGGRVAAVGSAADLRSAFPRARILDLSGTTVTPGLTDAHAHLTEWAFARRETDLSEATSPAAAAALIAHATARAGSEWIRGRGWNPHLWREAPTRAALDDVAPHIPAALQSHDMHALWVNGEALRRAGIDASTPDPAGGTIVRDADGEPTGLLLEWAGQLVMRCIPPRTLADTIAAVDAAQAELHGLGITGVHSFPGVHLTRPDALEVVRGLHASGNLRLRVLQHMPLDLLDHAIDAGLRSGQGDAWLRIGGVKMFLDGALGSRTAWMREPYEGGAGRGMRMMEPEAFRNAVQHAAANGIAAVVHAIGDAAVDLALDVLGDPAVHVDGMPHRIEHLQCCAADRLADAARCGIVCSMQPAHLMTDWSIADTHWGVSRAQTTYAFGSLLRHGTILAFGSDVPVEPVDPRLGLAAAVARTNVHGAPAGGWFPAERISPVAALHGYTTGPARAAGLPEPAGTLAVGAQADFAAWDHDPWAEPDMILRMRCTTAAIDGIVVHES